MREFLIALILSASAFSQTVQVKTDKFTGRSWLEVDCGEQSTLKDKFVMDRWGRLTLMGFPGNPSVYSIRVYLRQKSWMFIQKGKSLTFKADGTFIPLSGEGSQQDRNLSGSSGIEEIAEYDITLEQLHQIAATKDPAQFRLTGSQGFWDGALSPKAVKAMNAFLAIVPAGDWSIHGNQVVPTTSAPAPAPPPAATGLRIGIMFGPGPNSLFVAKVDPASPNKALLNKFIVAIEGERGSANVLKAKLGATVAQHQDGKPFKVTVADAPQGSEEETTLNLF